MLTLSQFISNIEKIKDFPIKNSQFLEELTNKLERTLKGKRRLMYSDILNYIAKKECAHEVDSEMMTWCCYMIRKGNDYVNTFTRSTSIEK